MSYQACQAFTAILTSYQPLEHLLKSLHSGPCTDLVSTSEKVVGGMTKLQQFLAMPLTTLSDVLTISVQGPECEFFSRQSICFITQQFCSTCSICLTVLQQMLDMLDMLDMLNSFYTMPAVVFYTTQILYAGFKSLNQNYFFIWNLALLYILTEC